MVRVEVQVPVCIQAAIIPPVEQGVKKGESSVFHPMVNLMDSHKLFRWVRGSFTVPLFTMQQVSSTYLFRRRGFVGAVLSPSSSRNLMWSCLAAGWLH